MHLIRICVARTKNAMSLLQAVDNIGGVHTQLVVRGLLLHVFEETGLRRQGWPRIPLAGQSGSRLYCGKLSLRYDPNKILANDNRDQTWDIADRSLIHR